MAKIGKQLTAYTASEDGTTVISENDGFFVTIAAEVGLKLRADDTEVVLPLLASVHYPYDVKSLSLDDSTPTTVVYVVRGQDQ